jgi:hypothetical protein
VWTYSGFIIPENESQGSYAFLSEKPDFFAGY